ncbi:MAG: GNAT family N-acetyltransferase [Lachnospiraceae bacterium]|nr:GNAT family N-acetyltransferase [Lachnospiraceae bacterium]
MIQSYKKSESSVRINGCNTQEIETERLVLRPFRLSDAQSALMNWAGDEKVQKMYGEPVYQTVEEVESLLEKYITAYKSDFFYRWAVIEKESGECIGQVAYFLVDKSNSWGEIEYCIGSAYQGKGYATEATKAVIRYGFDKIGFHKVQICVRPSNIKSARVIEKCGFTYEGTLRDYFLIDGKYEGRMYYSILKNENGI